MLMIEICQSHFALKFYFSFIAKSCSALHKINYYTYLITFMRLVIMYIKIIVLNFKLFTEG